MSGGGGEPEGFAAAREASARRQDLQEKDSDYEVRAAQAKVQDILKACERRDIDALKRLAVSQQGFISDSIRTRAWPVLLGIDLHEYDRKDEYQDASKEQARAESDSWTELPRHRDEDQVRLDVERSFIYYPESQTPAQLEGKKVELSDLITRTLRRHPYLCYFQGYHDICQVFLLVLPPALRAVTVARLSALRIRDFMLPNLSPAVAQLRLIPDILDAADPKLCAHLSATEPFFALSGTLTMYAHDVQSYGDIMRLFDALLAREQVFSVYMFAQIVLNRRAELFDTPASEPEMLHSILSKLPQPLRLEELIADTARLFARHPPESLPAWRGVSNSSVLKTARDVEACAGQTMEQGHEFFNKQLKELEWAEKVDGFRQAAWAYRRPITRGVAVAVLVALAAVYMRKAPGGMAYMAYMGNFFPRVP